MCLIFMKKQTILSGITLFFSCTELLTADETIPIVSKTQKDIRQLLLMASGHGDRSQGPWSAALLRVIHTLVHSHSYLNNIYHDDIRSHNIVYY